MDEGALGREYNDGELICRQGELGEHMYVIQAGRVEVVCEEGGGEIFVAELNAGDVFGEMALFNREPRSATVRARGMARVLTVDKRVFLKQVQQDPSLVFRILQTMSQRIRSLDAELALLRGVTSRVFMVRYLFVVNRDRHQLYEQLASEFSGDREVEVLVDRRSDERRRDFRPREPERRQEERRRALEGWTVYLSEPYRGSRGGGRKRLTTSRPSSTAQLQ